MPIHAWRVLAVLLALAPTAAVAQSPPPLYPAAPTADTLYQGWRARTLMGQGVELADSRVGHIQDIILDRKGSITALIVEGGGIAGLPDAIYRVPWQTVDLTPGRQGVTAVRPGGPLPDYSLFPGTPGGEQLPREFRASEVIGDTVRLQTGAGYGVVSDLVFTRDGKVVAVLVSRDVAAGGGSFAFPFSGYSSPWDPGMSYFGLRAITEEQARQAGLRIDTRRFEGAL